MKSQLVLLVFVPNQLFYVNLYFYFLIFFILGKFFKVLEDVVRKSLFSIIIRSRWFSHLTQNCKLYFRFFKCW
jgi:hypothetical protein